MKRVGILFLGGAKRVSMGRKFLEAGKKLGLEVKLFSYELSPWVPVAEIAEIVIGKRWSDPGLPDDLARVVRDKGIDILIPFVDGAVEVAARCRDSVRGVWTPVGDASRAAEMFDKISSDRIFREAGLPVPASVREFPMIAKPRFGSASKGIRILASPAELEALENRGNYLIQEYISPRKEITVDCYVAMNGDIICTVPRYRIEIQGGEASVTRTFRNLEVEALACRTLEATSLRGAVTIQMIERPAPGNAADNAAKEPRYVLMEINPRLGGGAVCACHAGAPLSEFILRDALGLPLSPCADWKPDILITRYFSEVCFDLSHEAE